MIYSTGHVQELSISYGVPVMLGLKYIIFECISQLRAAQINSNAPDL